MGGNHPNITPYIFFNIKENIFKKGLKEWHPLGKPRLKHGRDYIPYLYTILPGFFCHSYIDLSLISGFFEIP